MPAAATAAKTLFILIPPLPRPIEAGLRARFNAFRRPGAERIGGARRLG